MSKDKINYAWLQTKGNSATTLVEKAIQEVPKFSEHYIKFDHQITIKSYSKSTVFSYSRAIAQISLYFKKSPLDLDPDEINDYLYKLRKQTDLSNTYFKHTVYGLRFFFRVHDLEDRVIQLPKLKKESKLPVVFSQKELRLLFKSPQRLKQRVILTLIYSAGLRVSEVCNLLINDIDFDRKQIHVRLSKNDKSRYVILSNLISKGLSQYIEGAKPKVYLFNGREKGSRLGTSAVQQAFRLAMDKTGINKDASVHTLRHTFATHLLEQGVDIVTIKEQLGHSHVETTMMYLHVAQIERKLAHSPFDRLYLKGVKA